MNKSSKDKQENDEKRSGKDRRKFSFGYPGSDRRKGKDRRKQNGTD
ncbi:MAG: hypothetical protein KJ757_02525 [Planctomycetes bacterium]|nr:hypothetical protein [Planctomycetota bacterium]MBU1518263.1 hypothetical protein [Planctomycetota bacterium]MBU2457022.1 hypothetical protein [Planctomycetota bacterium]MBU2596427.1 hypothetical protein [Planctomycetota bacterium]